jgi:hypothetical protein
MYIYAAVIENPTWQYRQIVRSIKDLGYSEYTSDIYVSISNMPASWTRPLRSGYPPTRTSFYVVLKKDIVSKKLIEKMANEIKTILDNEYIEEKKWQEGTYKHVELLIEVQKSTEERSRLAWWQTRLYNSNTKFEWQSNSLTITDEYFED